jgi:hypothetical protein
LVRGRDDALDVPVSAKASDSYPRAARQRLPAALREPPFVRPKLHSGAIAAAPGMLTLQRNRDLAGRERHPVYRRALLALVAVLPVLALLNVFGQDPSTSAATSPAAHLSVTAPAALRGGLIFQVRVEISAHTDIAKPQIVMSPGWWQEMSVNSIEPQPSTESSNQGSVVLSYDKLQSGQSLVVWLYFQVNPTNVGSRDEDIALYDGKTLLTRIERSVTVFP